jgi:tripartite-type tricarboxylate transporter receptor subunit TctC
MKPTHRRQFLHLAAGAAALSVVSGAAWAQVYPTRPIRWVVPFPPGGATDTLTRFMAQYLTERLGQPVVIENRPGAATNIGAQAVINSPPDGYTLLLVVSSATVNATLYRSLPFNFLRDIAPVGGFASLPFVIVANPSLTYKTIPALIAYAKANPGKVNFGSFGTGTISHLAIELLKLSAGIDVVHVPYRGGAPLVTDILGGAVALGVDALPNSLPHIERGALAALAVTDGKRSRRLPAVPTVGEAVVGYEVSGIIGLGVPAATPRDIVERLNRELNAGLADPAVKARLMELGAEPEPTTPAQFGAHLAAETEKWAKVIRAADIKAE